MKDLLYSSELYLPWAIIKILGADRKSFLHKQTTNDVNHLLESQFHLNALTDNKGRLLSYFLLFNKADAYFLMTEPGLLEVTLARLEQFHITEDVSFENVGQGLKLVLGIEAENSMGEGQGIFWGEKATLSFDSKTSNEEEFENIRLRSGFQKYKHELTNNDLINNTFFLSAVSFSKGCYPGQETVNKIFNNRGAAYYPVALESENDLSGDLSIENKKIGNILNRFQFLNKNYYLINLDREHRVNKTKITFDQGTGKVFDIPLLSTSPKVRSEQIVDFAQDYFVQNKDDEAIELFQYALKLDPNNEDLIERLGVLLGRQNRFEEAIQTMESLLKVNPISSIAHTNLSVFHMKKGNIEEAEKHKDQAVLKSFEQFAKKASDEKKIKEEQEKEKLELDRREKMFLDVLDIDPIDSFALTSLSEIYFKQNQVEKLNPILSKLLEIEPENFKGLFLQGKKLLIEGRKEDAHMSFIKAQKLAAKKGDHKLANEIQTFLSNF